MIPQAEADRICRRANELEQLRNELRAIGDDPALVDEITHCVWLLRRYVCGGVKLNSTHTFIIAQDEALVTTFDG